MKFFLLLPDIFRDWKLQKHLFTLNLTLIPVYYVFIIPQTWFSQILRSNSLKLTIQDHVELIIQDQVKKQFLDVFRDFKLQKHLFTLNLTPIPVYHVFIIPLTWFSSTLRSNLLKLIILDHVTYQYQKQQKNKNFPKVVKSCSFSGWPLILSWTAIEVGSGPERDHSVSRKRYAPRVIVLLQRHPCLHSTSTLILFFY